MKRGLPLLLALGLFLPLLAGKTVKRGPNASAVVPGLVGSGGNGATLGYLYDLQEFMGIDESQFTTRLWVDPFYGSDLNPGTYALPYRSFARFKQRCLLFSHMHCSVKGRGRVFSHETLTVTYAAGDHAVLAVGETVTFASPAGTATVLAVDRNLVVTTWLSGTDPLDRTATTTFTGASSGSTGTVTAVADTINGLGNWTIPAASITFATDIITAAGHSFVTGDGPFEFYNQTTIPTAVPAITEGVTDVYICTVVAGVTFQLGTTSACGTIFNFSDAGVGTNQIISSLATGSPGLSDSIQLNCNDEEAICTLFDSEFPESPWMLDGNRYYPNGAIALYSGIAGVSDTFWSGIAAGGVYNPATGGLFFAQLAGGVPDNVPWLAVENGIIQNISNDGIATGEGGKAIFLNVKTIGIRNGGPTAGSTNGGDRSMVGMTNPQYQAHNSCASMYGINGTTPTNTASVTYWINGDGSSNEMGSDQASGGCLNPNGTGASRVFTQGTLSADGILTDVNCAGTTCNTPIIVAPGGDFVLVGPELRIGGTSLGSSGGTFGISQSGDDERSQIAKTLFNVRSVYAVNDATAPGVIFYGGGSQGKNKTLLLWESTFRRAGPAEMLRGCPLQGTTAGTATSTMTLLARNVLLEGFTTGDFMANFSNCGVAGGYTVADAVARAKVKFEGIWDIDDNAACGGGLGPCFVYNPNARRIGACGTGATFLDDVCIATDSAGNNTPDDNWRWFQDNSFDSGGVGVNGTQWGTTEDLSYRCQSGKDCYHFTQAAGGAGAYTLDLRSYFTGNKGMACSPKGLLPNDARLCSLTLTPTHVGGR